MDRSLYRLSKPQKIANWVMSQLLLAKSDYTIHAVILLTWSDISKCAAHQVCIAVTPLVPTNCAPLPIEADFHPSSIPVGSSYQSDVTISACSNGCCKDKVVTVLASTDVCYEMNFNTHCNTQLCIMNVQRLHIKT